MIPPLASIKSALIGAKWLIVVGAIGLLSLALGVQTVRLAGAKAEGAEMMRAHAQDRAQAEEAARLASENYRREEQRRAAAQQEAANEAAQSLAAARADAASAAGAADRLRSRIDAIVAEARRPAAHPAAAGGSPPAGDPVGLLADLFRLADERAGILAAIADERGIAGQLCADAYDALRAEP